MKPATHALAIATLIASPALHAVSEPLPAVSDGLMQMLLGLAVVVAMLLGCLWLIKRLSTPHGAARGLKVLGAVAVGTRERVVLVEIADKVLVLGVTTAHINALHTLDASELPRDGAASSQEVRGTDFAQWLRKSLERKPLESKPDATE